MFVYSRVSNDKIVHFAQCGFAKKINPENVGTFYSLEEVRKAGYRLCMKCDPLLKEYRRHSDYLDEVWRNERLMCEYDGGLKVSAPESEWQIVTKNTHTFNIYHRNVLSWKTWESEFDGFHLQHQECKSIRGAIKYILAHEEYRSENKVRYFNRRKYSEPARKGTKRWRKDVKKQKHYERRQQVARVNKLLEMLEAGAV